MSHDDETLAVYDAQAQAYAEMVAREVTPGLPRFISGLPDGARVLDLGCGPGQCAVEMAAHGLSVAATDASVEMVALARAQGVAAQVAVFAALTEQAQYDGVWANFSLLHMAKSDLPDVLARIHAALVPNGLFHIGMKLGTGEHRDTIGRFYAHYSEDELLQHLTTAGFTPDHVEHGEGTGLDGSLSRWILVQSHG
ncbi:class I SAM-dependent methyltransferase [Aliiroseovarius sp.]|uniref:class I SAM-dependent DNA methyltransferase n=1 Tax=Aliiroseovarius sp. TaxID=1872442 RepID=UPI002607E0B0|nr:class I SAM-dependent methyltransferase [Aliiroseovarius sp.]